MFTPAYCASLLEATIKIKLPFATVNFRQYLINL